MQTSRIVDRPFDPLGQILGSGTGLAGVGVFMEGSGNSRRIVGGEKGRVITRQVTTGTGQGNQADAAMHFGLGDHSGEVTLEILWPGNRRQSVKTPVDRVVTVKFAGK